MASVNTSAPTTGQPVKQAAATHADPTKAQTVKAISAPPFQITPLRTEHRYLKALFYGPFGCGKTSLAGSAVDVPEMSDVFMVNAESGTLSIEDADYIRNRFRIDQVRCKDFRTVALVQEFLTAHCRARDANNITALKALQARMFGYAISIIDESPDAQDEFAYDENESLIWTKARLRKYKTVIVDSLTEIDTFSMYDLLNIKTDMKLDGDMEVAQFAEFRKNNQMMQLLVRAYRDLPMHVLLVCSTQYNQDELKQMHWVPSVTGKLAAQIQGFVDIVGFMQVGKPKEGDPKIPRRLYVQPVARFDAKNRIASFREAFIDDPSMTKIMAAFNKSSAHLNIVAKAS